MEYEFKPFEKVLVRDKHDGCFWRASLFSHYNYDSEFRYVTVSSGWECCIPFEGNEHLLGTANIPKEKEKPFEWGEKLLYKPPLSERDTECVFLFTTEHGEAHIHCIGDYICTRTKIENLSRPTEG